MQGTTVIHLPRELHYELKVEAAKRKLNLNELVAAMWKVYQKGAIDEPTRKHQTARH